MKFLRTPDRRFKNLKDYPYEPNYITIDGLRMHYVQEGPISAPTILLLHGEPTWSYLYRDMIRILSNEGFNVIAPDLIGFGKSDKPILASAYSYANHLNWLAKFININIMCSIED